LTMFSSLPSSGSVRYVLGTGDAYSDSFNYMCLDSLYGDSSTCPR
jgi:hypothetical protein